MGAVVGFQGMNAGGKPWLEGRKGEERARFTCRLDYRWERRADPSADLPRRGKSSAPGNHGL